MIPINKSHISFSGSRRGEIMCVDEEEFTIPVGGVFLAIAELSTDFFEKIYGHRLFLESINRENFAGMVSQITDKVLKLDAPSFLKKILLWYPMCRAEAVYRREFNKYTLSDEEVRELMGQNPGVNSLRKLYKQREKSDMRWNVLRALFNLKDSGCTIQDWNFNQDQLDALYKCFQKYRDCCEMIMNDIEWLGEQAKLYLAGSKSVRERISREIYAVGDWIGTVTGDNNNQIYKKKTQRKYSNVYSAEGLTDIVALELNLVTELYVEFRQCELCKRYFVPYSFDSKYCKNPNPNYNNKKCNEVGTKKDSRKRRSNDQLTRVYDKYYKRYNKWRGENVLIVDVDAVKDEIEDGFKRWQDKASQVMDDYAKNKISLEDAEKEMEPPKANQRSPMFTEWRRDKRDGIQETRRIKRPLK